MRVELAKNYGFCFGVKRAIRLAEENPNSITIGPLIHNPREIKRLSSIFNVNVSNNLNEIGNRQSVIIRTHGIPKSDYNKLIQDGHNITDATCPFVVKPQQICEDMDTQGYSVVIFGDINHPEIKGIMSYVKEPHVVLSPIELDKIHLKEKVAIVAQTTKRKEDFLEVVNYLIGKYREVRVFNTICNATFDNQASAEELSRNVDIMLVIGGKNSSNTTQLHTISQLNCKDSYLIEDAEDINIDWFKNKQICGVTAGASTPEWIVEEVVNKVKKI